MTETTGQPGVPQQLRALADSAQDDTDVYGWTCVRMKKGEFVELINKAADELDNPSNAR